MNLNPTDSGLLLINQTKRRLGWHFVELAKELLAGENWIVLSDRYGIPREDVRYLATMKDEIAIQALDYRLAVWRGAEREELEVVQAAA